MENNSFPCKFFSEDLPPEYRAWYLSNQSAQSQPLEPSDQLQGSWSPFLGTSQPLTNTFVQAPSTQEAQPTSETPLSFSSIYGQKPMTHEQTWNYMYYLHLLSESEQVQAFADTDNPALVNLDSDRYLETPVMNANLPFLTPHVETPTSSRPETPVKSSSLYSTMLKKGLKSLPKFLTTEDSTKQQGDNIPSVRRNSYPNVPVHPPANPSPLVSTHLDHNSLKEHYKQVSSKKSSALPKQASPICKGCQETFESVLNNSVNISCPRGSKCLLNVNNDLNGLSFMNSELPSSTFVYKDSEETDAKQQKRRKSKPKVSIKSVSQLEAPAATANNQEDVKRNKPKGFQNKSKSKSERERSHKKRHSMNDLEEPSPLFNLVFQLRVRISQLPIQPLVTTLAENVVSLMGIAVGLLWVFAMLSWEWAQNLLHLLHDWVRLGWKWVQTFKGDLIETLLRRIPGISSTSGGKNGTKGFCANEEFNLPKTGDEAVQRLLQLKETDPYSILGVPSEATDEDIKRSYKTQAILVHPDKNPYPGAEEAFKILASAFEIIGNPEKRARYDEEHILNRPRSEVSHEISDFLEKLKQNIEEAQSILGCQNCGKTHKRYRMDRSASEARYCAACRDRHCAKEGDLWAETSMMGFKWHYYSYLDGAIYDVTEWVTCQPHLVSRVEANTHWVPCRLATPKNKNRNAAFSRMEDLKDLVNDLLNPKQGLGSETASDPRAATPNDNKFKARRTGGRRKK